MPRRAEERKSDRLGAVAALALVLLLPPIVMLPSGGFVGDWPAIYLWVFAGWALIIGLLIWAVHGRPPPPKP
jgi:peptidoglycan/LPS O-acetylase OafA/YrhL